MSRADCLARIVMMGSPCDTAWLDHVTTWYNALGDEEKNCVLDKLISASGPHQLLMLSKKFPDLLFRDFVTMLPPELAHMILHYLDGETLIICCRVSKAWHDRITHLGQLWIRVAIDCGVDIHGNTCVFEEEDEDHTEAETESAQSLDINESEPSIVHLNVNEVAKYNVKGPGYKQLFCHAQRVLRGLSAGQLRCMHNMRDDLSRIHPGWIDQQHLRGLEMRELLLQLQGPSRLRDFGVLSSGAGSGEVLTEECSGTLNESSNSSEPSTIDINEVFIDKGTWRVTSVKYYKGNVVTGSDDHTVQVWSVPEGRVINTVSTHSVCCLTVTDTHLYTASFNANAECWDLATGQHTKTFSGHTSAVLAIDVSSDEHFLLTGSVDKTAKLWDLTVSGVEQLVTTLEGTHMDWVFQVKFLPRDNPDVADLQFLTCDSNVCCLWRVSEVGVVLACSHVTSDSSTKFTSFYHAPETKGLLWACQWTEADKSSTFCRYTLDLAATQIHRLKSFRINLDNIKAFLLGAGSRFAVIMCSISRKDFHVLDILKQTVIATIATPDFYVLTRNGSTVTLCDTSWLNGLQFSSMTPTTPVFAAGISLNKVMLGTWAQYVSQLS